MDSSNRVSIAENFSVCPTGTGTGTEALSLPTASEAQRFVLGLV